MIARFFTIIFIIFSPMSYASECIINLCSKMSPRFIIVNNDLETLTREIEKNANCSADVIGSLANLIMRYNGNLSNAYFNEIIKQEITSSNITIIPKDLSFSTLEELTKKVLSQQEDKIIKEIKLANNIKSFCLAPQMRISLSCQSCSSTGEKNFKIEIYDSKNSEAIQTFWASGKLSEKVQTWIAKKNIPNTKTFLTPDDVTLSWTYEAHPERVFSNNSNIQFYRPLRNISTGSVLGNSDVIPVELVKRGLPTKVMLTNGNISLNSTAIPISSGKFNDIVQLQTTGQTQRIIQGRVIDMNKVVVEL